MQCYTIVQVVGDNLGLNGILGYNESFSGHFCGLYTADTLFPEGSDTESLSISKLLRDIDSNKADLETKDPSKTGDSVLNSAF